MAATILLVEDDDLSRDMLQRRLERKNYQVVTALDGAQAVALATSRKPDLILMDLSLPILDGWMATQQIRATFDLTQMPIIGLTAHALLGDREKALAVGCNDYDTKPVDFNRLLEKIEALLGNS
jgi:CheY-like chemotaxis protein